ncbi:MAG: chromate transporter [Eubacteriales bacterium]|nr:chromate transporter [Eubacteriales bacterium]
MILLQLVAAFAQVGLFSIGGGYAAMPLIQQQTVTLNGWLTMAEFTDLITIAEMTPGPIAINAATFVGMRIAGPLGAVAATLGCILPSLIIVSVLAFVYFRYRKLDALQSVLGSLRPAVVALIAGAGLGILQTVVFSGKEAALANVDWIGAVLFAAAFAVLRIKKTNPILVMASCGVLGLAAYLIF